MKEQLNLISMLESFTGLASADVLKVVRLYSHKYKRFSIPKKNGGYRIIFHPAPQLKMLQYAIDLNVIQRLPVSSIAMAYRKNLKSPLRNIAEAHSRYPYTVRIDFKDFFPSLNANDLLPIIQHHYSADEIELELISQILFWGHSIKTLPIGAPSSPSISNVIMERYDNYLINLKDSINKHGVVSRYADDVFFSSSKKGDCSLFFDHMIEYCDSCKSPKLKINHRKVLFLSKGTKRVICGITIASQGWASIGRQRKIEIKKMLYHLKNGTLLSEDMPRLRGLMAFIKDVEPRYYNNLIIKYGNIQV